MDSVDRILSVQERLKSAVRSYLNRDYSTEIYEIENSIKELNKALVIAKEENDVIE